ncbi:Golgi SNAP receptor complex, subunit 1 [Tanacetum coccineum]|uniref:Golgi SNAP receptor complex, subunit 1 n=1 Tax=Tanacetum coccineum TaxID=301880 RepID=A0ABQ4YNB8_9ASTR
MIEEINHSPHQDTSGKRRDITRRRQSTEPIRPHMSATGQVSGQRLVTSSRYNLPPTTKGTGKCPEVGVISLLPVEESELDDQFTISGYPYARNLEAQLNDEMHLYRRLVSTKADGDENDLGSRIEQLLKQLHHVMSQMQALVSSGGSGIFSHTLNRFQEIHRDLSREFNRLRSSLKANKEHASLLDDFREFDRARLDLEEGGASQEQSLLKERATLMRTTGQMDGVLSQAQETLGTLMFQRSTFGGINSKLTNVSSRLPTVNSILMAIKKKKSMDTIILSLVASVCTFLILIYWITK